MDRPSRTVGALVVGLLVGVVLGALLAGALLPTTTSTSPTTTLTTATGCRPADEPVAPSWVGQVPAGDEEVVVLNHTIRHDSAGLDVRSDLTESGDGRYVLHLSTTPTTEKAPPEDCHPRTRLTAVVGLPAPYRSLTVELDGERLADVEYAGSTPQFRSLNASAGAHS
ncbi:MAG: hypothetical protein ABEJ82_04780 [Haloplanus sp.]